MAETFESIIEQLLLKPSNEAQTEGFHKIQELFKDHLVCVQLCNTMIQAEKFIVRRYAALLLRRRLLKLKHWKKVPLEAQTGLKIAILEAYIKENEKCVRDTIAEVVAVIAKHELHHGKWKELLDFLSQSICSKEPNVRAEGLYCLSVIARALGNKLKPHFKTLLALFHNTLTDTSNMDIPFHTIRALTHMVPSIGSEEQVMFQQLLPNVIVVIKLITQNAVGDEREKAVECMEIFDELVESEVAVLAPHLKSLVELCLEMAAAEILSVDLRIKAISIISYLVRLKKKTIIKQKLTQPIVDVLFPLMCQSSPGDLDDNLDDEDLELSIPSAAGQAVDIMALHLPPTKFMPILMHHLQAALESPNPLQRKGAYIGMSVIAEGCSEYIRYKHLPMFVPVIIQGIKDSDAIVRNAALYAIGQYAEYLQPEISKYASELLPVLFENLQNAYFMLTQQGNSQVPSLTRTFYAVEQFCENLEDIEPFLPHLMRCLTSFLTLESEKSNAIKELAVEAIGSVAGSAKSNFVPYFDAVFGYIKNLISAEYVAETSSLQIQALDALAIIVRTVGAETFQPLSHDTVKCGMYLIEKNDDPDIRRACYGLFSSLATIMKTDMQPYLKHIIERMITTLRSVEGFSISTNEDSTTHFSLNDSEDTSDEDVNIAEDIDLHELEEEDAIDQDITGLNVENAFLVEKEGAILALSGLCEQTGSLFLPFFEISFDEVKAQADHISEDVRKAAVGALGQFCITLNQIYVETGNLDYKIALDRNLSVLFLKIFWLSREDTENTVVLGCLETLQNIIDKVGGNAMHAANLESVCLLLRDVFKNKLACQDEGAEEEDNDEQEAEYDSMLMEYAGDIIASLIKVVPWQQFAPYLAGLMPFLLNKSKKACTMAEKSFSIGTLAEIVDGMEVGAVRPFLTHLQPVFLAGMKEDNEEVRSNAVYGLGCLVKNAGEIVFDQYPTYLQALSKMVEAEEDPRAKDNICGAVARLIKTNIKGIPIAEVFPVFLKFLPLKEDLEENANIYDCLAYLYSIRCEEVFKNLPELLKICSETLTTSKEINDSTLAVVSSLLNSIYNDYPSEFEKLLVSLPPANAEALTKARATSLHASQ